MESLEEIQRLSHQYAWAADTRDIEGLLDLFVPDVDCGRQGRGRDVLRSWYDVVHRQFYRTVHQVTGVLIDLQDEDHATGKIQMRAEHEADGRWVVGLTTLFDTYERRDGVWLFARRKPELWYASDILERPAGPNFGDALSPTGRHPRLPHMQETWGRFWDGHEDKVERLSRFP